MIDDLTGMWIVIPKEIRKPCTDTTVTEGRKRSLEILWRGTAIIFQEIFSLPVPFMPDGAWCFAQVNDLSSITRCQRCHVHPVMIKTAHICCCGNSIQCQKYRKLANETGRLLTDRNILMERLKEDFPIWLPEVSGGQMASFTIIAENRHIWSHAGLRAMPVSISCIYFWRGSTVKRSGVKIAKSADVDFQETVESGHNFRNRQKWKIQSKRLYFKFFFMIHIYYLPLRFNRRCIF